MKLRRFFWQTLITFFILSLVSTSSFLLVGLFVQVVAYNVLISTVIALSLGVYLSFRVARPLERLKERVELVAGGELDEVVDLSRNEVLEIHEIAKLMDQISAELLDRIDLIQRQKEELEAVLTSMDEGLVAVDKGHVITHFNPSAAQLFRTHREAVLGRRIEEVVRLPEFHRMVEEALDTGEGHEEDVLLAGESRKFLRVHSSPLRNQFGHQYGVVMVVSDVTRIRELEGMRKNFVANVSHELRTPLTSIQGFAETLDDGGMDDAERSKKFVGIIRKHADRLSRIIEDILTLSRIEKDSEEEQMEKEEASMAGIVESAVELCAMKAKKKNMSVESDIRSQARLLCDRYLLEQSVVNLIDNAIRYSDEGSKILVRCFDENGSAVVEVQDFGVGIEDRQKERIFERFYRVDRARSRELGGTGLGLSIVKHIAQAHSGKVSVESQLGEGSTFRLSLPNAPS